MKTKVTIKDVAKYANVSVATVSRVMNNKGYVYEGTKQSVLDAIKELGFEPNQLARSLTNHRSGMIGIIVPHLGTNFYGGLIDGIEKAALKYNYKTMICNTQDDSTREKEYIRIIDQYNIEGLIVASNCHYTEELLKLNLPIVSVDHDLDPSIPSIASNNYNGGRQAGLKFRLSGAKNILLLRGPSFLLTSIERTNGFLSAFDEDDQVNIKMLDSDLIEPYTKEITQYLENNEVDAIFAFSDTLALVALGIAQKLGKKVPEDIQIIGFDDAPFAKWTNPAISTISQSIDYIGLLALETLNKIINGDDIEEHHIMVDINYIDRETTK